MTPLVKHYEVPLDLVRAQASANGVVFILRAEMRGAVLKPVARVWQANGHWVADIDFESPIGPEQQKSVLVQLGPISRWAA